METKTGAGAEFPPRASALLPGMSKPNETVPPDGGNQQTPTVRPNRTRWRKRLYTFWYQIKPFSSSGNVDALVWGLMMVLSLAFILVPFLPGVRPIPRWTRVYKLIWRDWYRTHPPVQRS